MCVNPTFVWVQRGPGYEQQPVPCRTCWRCMGNRVSDFVGRALCEAAYSEWTCVLTLTYRPRLDLADKVIHPKHAQKFIRSLRDTHRYKIRYVMCGEYGSFKGRAHFHVLLFGNSADGTHRPEWPHQTNFQLEPHWPHGHAFADWNADEASIRYVLKYMNKVDPKWPKPWFTMSKKPPLGWQFFEEKADQAVAHGVLPSSFLYTPPGGQDGRQYHITGATRRLYLLRICEGLAIPRGPLQLRAAEWVEKALVSAWRFADVKAANLNDKTYPDLAFADLVERIRDQEEIAARVFNADWQNRFDEKQKRLQRWAERN